MQFDSNDQPLSRTPLRSSLRSMLRLTVLVAVAAVVFTVLPRQAAAQSTPTISVSCPDRIRTIAENDRDIGHTGCTFTASPAPTSPVSVTYRVSGQGERTLSQEQAVVMAAASATGTVSYLRNTTETITVSVEAGTGYVVGNPSSETIAVGDWVDTDPRPSVGVSVNDSAALDGYVLITSAFHNRFYLVDSQGRVAYQWNRPGALGKLLDNGTLLAGHTGTNVAEISPDGTDAYTHSTPDQHHDVLKLPNGDYMYIDSDYLTAAEASAAGVNPACLPNGNDQGQVLELDSIVVIRPDGTSGGNEIWRWNVRDHLIQDFDSSKDNYGVVADHPELIDVNYGLCRMHKSFNVFLKNPHHLTHLNSIDYNAELNQILITSRHFSEAWVIDYSTTTAEAAGSSGGTYGKGGDLLYRWGNPRTYRGGTKHDQELFFPHNAHWIASGLPGAGNVLVYNNGFEHPGYLRDYASVDEVVFPAHEGNYLTVGGRFMRPAYVWSYFTKQRTWLMSNAQRLPNGNTLVTEGEHGRITEVTPAGEVVWHYRSPLVRGTQVLESGSEPAAAGDVWIYRAYKYPADHPGISALTLVAESNRQTIEQPKAGLPQVSVSYSGSAVTEGGTASFTVTATPAPSAALTVNVNVAERGDFGVTTGPATVTIPTSGAATLTVATSNDSADEADGSITVTVTIGRGYRVSSNSSTATAAVQDDDTPCAVTLPSDAVTVSEVEGWRDEYSHTDHVQRWDRVLAALGVDNGETKMTVAESREIEDQFNNTRWERTTRTLAELTKCDDPPPAVPEVSIAAGPGVTEGNNAVFTLTADPAPAAPLSVTVAVTTSGDFGVTPTTHTVTVATTGTGTLTLPTTNDSTDEPNGSVTATLNSAQGYTVSSTAGTATVAVADDDGPAPPPPAVPEVSIAAGSGVTEGNNAVFTLTADPAPAAPLSVTVTVTTSGDFGVTPTTHTVTVATTGTGTLTLPTTNDSTDEPNGSVTATVNSAQGYTVSATQGSATIAVEDDDPPASKPSISVADATAGEGDGAVGFTVELSAASAGTVTVHYSMWGGTATAHDDYRPAWGSVTFAPGETSQTVQVSLIDDRTPGEGTETFVLRLRLFDTTHATMGDGQATMTITDND